MLRAGFSKIAEENKKNKRIYLHTARTNTQLTNKQIKLEQHHRPTMAKAKQKKKVNNRQRKKKTVRPARRENRRVQMLPETKEALQAITSPFKAKENSAKIPDGKGGESFSTTDKLRKSENNSVWLADIKQANDQWIQFSNLLCPRFERDGVHPVSAPLSTIKIGDVQGIFKDSQPNVGWNILANNAPVAPYYTDCPVTLVATDSTSVGLNPYVPFQQWRDIEIQTVYYFAVPGVSIDATKGNLGGPINNTPACIPSGGSSLDHACPSIHYDGSIHHNFHGIPQDPVTGIPWPLSGIKSTAGEANNWLSTHDLELDQSYGIQCSAPMQVYRVIDFTYSMGTPPSDSAAVTNADLLKFISTMPVQGLSVDQLQKIAGQCMNTESNTTVDDSRYRCQTIHPLAGVTQWENKLTGVMGNTLYRKSNFFLPRDTRDLEMDKAPQKSERSFDVRSVSSYSERVDPFRMRKQDPTLKSGVNLASTNYTLSSDDPIVLPTAQSTYAAGQSSVPLLSVPSDFTFSEGHNGTISVKATEHETVDVYSYTGYPTFGQDGTPSGQVGDLDVVEGPLDITSEVSVDFKGGMCEARRTVAFGMKLFSTEAALTANGRITGGELPLGLVTDLLNFQDQNYTRGSADIDTSLVDWQPREDSMDAWTSKIESRLEDYRAFTARDGVTVRYNPLQTKEQSEYIYTSNESRLFLTPLAIPQEDLSYDPIVPPSNGNNDLDEKQLARNIGTLMPAEPETLRYILHQDRSLTAFSRVRAEIPMPYHPACDGSEMVPVITFSPADPVILNYSDNGGDQDHQSNDGLFFQAVLHTENLSSLNFPIETSDSVYDPNWECYSRICAESQNFPIVVKGHSFGSFFRKVGQVCRTAMRFGARAIEIGEVMLPLLGM